MISGRNDTGPLCATASADGPYHEATHPKERPVELD